MSGKVYPARSPPDGKSPPPSMADTSVVIPGFLSKSRDICLAVPLPAPVLLSKIPNSKSLRKQAHLINESLETSGPSRGSSIPRTKENIQPSAWRSSLDILSGTVENNTPRTDWRSQSSLGMSGGKVKEIIQPSAWRSSLCILSTGGTVNDKSLKQKRPFHKPETLESPKPAPRIKINSKVRVTPKPAPRFSTKRSTAQTSLVSPSISVSRTIPSPGDRMFLATPVSSTIHISGTPIHLSQKCHQTPKFLMSHQTSKVLTSQEKLHADSVPVKTTSHIGSVKSPDFSSDSEKRGSSEIAPYFIQPLNLCDPFLDNLGLAEICSLRVDELQYLTHTSHNKPVSLSDGSTKPSFLVRIWSRGSGKYLDLLSVGELYGRGMFGHSESFRLILGGPRTVMLQSARDPHLHVSMDRWTVTGKGSGGRACQFLVHQGPTGYCLLESLHSPGCFLGVRENGNIMRPTSVSYNCTEARFVIQKESMGAL